MLEMDQEAFAGLVDDALDRIPQELFDQIENCAVFIAEEPPEELLNSNENELFGLYEGTPLTERDDGWGGALPDQITIYKNPILRHCENHEEVLEEVYITVIHEVAHHFGIDDERLHELGWG